MCGGGGRRSRAGGRRAVSTVWVEACGGPCAREQCDAVCIAVVALVAAGAVPDGVLDVRATDALFARLGNAHIA
eukprot:6078817-Prymnesium_polylepis.1